MKRTAFITGVTGQDGAYLAQYLLAEGYTVWGGVRRSATPSLGRLRALGIAEHPDLRLVSWEQTEFSAMLRILRVLQPMELYNLAAQTFVKESFENPIYTVDVDARAVWHLLDAVRTVSPETKVYQASSSEMFGNTGGLLNEQSPMNPVSPYGAAKLAAYHAVRVYRDAYHLFACNGILFNHESPLRGEEFVTQKIVRGVIRLARDPAATLRLGNLAAARDWGFGGEYVRAMHLMLQHQYPDDYVIATGVATTVRDFLALTLAAVDPTGLHHDDWWDRVECDDLFNLRKAELHTLTGDASKARRVLGWKPTVTVEELVHMMVDAARVADVGITSTCTS